MNPRRAFAVVALALAGFAVVRPDTASAQAAAPASDTVRLRFAWPDGLEALVAYTRVTERAEGGPATRMEIEGEYDMHVHAQPGGLRIEHLNAVATRFQSTPALERDDPRRLAHASLGMLNADWMVTAEGRLVGLAGVEALAGAVVDALRPLGLDEAGLQTALAQVTSEGQLLSTARDLWRALVDDWVDVELTPGEAFATESEEANPVIPAVVLPYVHEYTLLGMEACDAPGGSCARLQVTSFPDPRELTRAMSEALQEMGMPHLSFERLVQLSQVTLLTDPATLLPREAEILKRVDGILLDGGERKPFRRVDETHLRFTYGAGAR